MVLGSTDQYGSCPSGRCFLFLLSLTSREKSLKTWFPPQYCASICKNRSHSSEKKCIHPQLCQPILMVISLSSIPKVAASIARKIVAWAAADAMCVYKSIVSHYITRPNLWTVIALKTLKTDIAYNFC